MECEKCYAYVYDTLCRPLNLPGMNANRAIEHADIFSREFVRACHDVTSDTDFLALLFMEAGGVKRGCPFTRRDYMSTARTWVMYQLREIGDLQQIHCEHSIKTPEPVVIAPLSPLRIRIPRHN